MRATIFPERRDDAASSPGSSRPRCSRSRCSPAGPPSGPTRAGSSVTARTARRRRRSPSGASSSAVGAGRQVGFFEWLRNGDTSNISQLYLTASTTPTRPWPARPGRSRPRRGQRPTGVCPAATPLTCAFGALNSGNTVYLVAAFATPSTLADGATQAVHFEFNTTGTPGGKNNSHGDAKAIDDQGWVM